MSSRSSRASALTGAALGSINALSSLQMTVFADPCSPDIASTGYGPRDRSVANSHITTNTRSLRLVRLSRGPGPHRSAWLRHRERQHARWPAEAHWRASDHSPPAGTNLDGAPTLVRKVKVNVAGMLGDADVDRPLRGVELSLRLEQIERRPDRLGAQGLTSLLIMATSQPGPKPFAADGPGLPLTIDQDIGKCGACGGMKQRATRLHVHEHSARQAPCHQPQKVSTPDLSQRLVPSDRAVCGPHLCACASRAYARP